MLSTFKHTLILLVAACISGQANAVEPPVKAASSSSALATMERNLEHALNKHVPFPVLANENMLGEVFVSFVIDKEGKVEVLNCHSENVALRSYVLRKLAKVDIGDNPDGIWKTTHMRFNFRPENG